MSGGFAAGMSQGILGVTVPKLEVLADLLVGPRGLLRLAPWFVLVPLGLLAFRRRGLRAEVAVSVAMVVGFLLFNAGYYLPFGGWTPGPRFLTPALPFAAILVALAPSRVRPLTGVLIAASIVLVFIATVTMPNAPERYEDPLVGLWLPRFLAGDLALTGAWLDWGVASIGALAVLLVGIALAEAGLVATFFHGRIARITTAATTAGLVVLLLVFSTPYMPWPTIAMAVTPEADRGIRITETGSARVADDGETGVSIWASLRNTGPVVDDTKIVFTVHTGPGAAWISWNGDVRWTTGDRRVARVRWDPSGEPPGDYPYDIRVVSQADEDVVYADLPNAGVIRLGPRAASGPDRQLDVDGVAQLEALRAPDRVLDRDEVAAVAREQRGPERRVADRDRDRDDAPAVGRDRRDQVEQLGTVGRHGDEVERRRTAPVDELAIEREPDGRGIEHRAERTALPARRRSIRRW